MAAPSTHLLASCRFITVARIDCGLSGSPRDGPMLLAAAADGLAVAMAPARGDPVVSLIRDGASSNCQYQKATWPRSRWIRAT